MSDLRKTIKETVVKLVGILAPRNRDIISRRFGLVTGQKETLESIGQSYKVTRERVRQIEETSLKQLKGQLASSIEVKVKPFVALAENILEQVGGVLNEKDFFERYFGSGTARNANFEMANAALAFILTLDGKLQRSNEDENFYSFWGFSKQHSDNYKNSVASLVSVLSKNHKPVAEADFLDLTKKTGVLGKLTNVDTLAASLSVSKQIGKNIFGQVGLTDWPEIKPRGVRDKSYLVLKKIAKPQHFRDIAKLINQTFNDRKANVQTVHNELIKDNRFVLVGRGMYGLAEWGYKAGTVKDVMVDLLRSANRPLKRNDIVTQVLSHRMVKENTILLNLQDSKIFKKTEDGYTLQA